LKADHASAMNKARDIARIASSHSYNALVFTKKSFIFAENHSVEDSLENCALLASNTIANSMDNDVKENVKESAVINNDTEEKFNKN